MNKIKYLVMFMGCMIAAPFCVQADCGYERQAELNRIAANVQLSYSYELVNEYPVFTVNLTNLTNDIYISENFLKTTISGTGEKNIRYNTDNKNIAFSIYSNDSNCRGQKLLTQYVNLPRYNFYITSNECKQYPNFKYCAMWINTAVTSDQFNEELSKYINTATVTEEEEPTFSEKLKQFFDENKTAVIASIIGVVLLIIIVIIRKRRREL